jgi:hypothetical protein
MSATSKQLELFPSVELLPSVEPFPYLDLDRLAGLTRGVLDYDAVEFFANGHCASMALALHALTGWPIFSNFGHAFVKSPGGWLDAAGLRHLRKLRETCREYAQWRYDWDDPDREHDYCFRVTADDLHYAQDHLELVMPFAEAVLDRYFRPTTAPRDEGGDTEGDLQIPTQLCFSEAAPFQRPTERDLF